MMPWDYYASVWSWLRHGLLIYWHCTDCGKRHLSTPKGWSKHIGYNVPLCTACEAALDRQYEEHMREVQAREATERFNAELEALWND